MVAVNWQYLAKFIKSEEKLSELMKECTVGRTGKR
jgi:hypothetical protein